MRRKVLFGSFTGLVVVLGVLQFVPVEGRNNPPVETEVDAPQEVKAVLSRACYDCHSNETEWPWYSYVAPVSWLVASDVQEGREHINFSTWNRYDAEERAEILEETWEEVEEGEMPLAIYLPLHPEARLTEADLATIRSWTQSADGPEQGASEEVHEEEGVTH